jgi:hypothetical protein
VTIGLDPQILLEAEGRQSGPAMTIEQVSGRFPGTVS